MNKIYNNFGSEAIQLQKTRNHNPISFEENLAKTHSYLVGLLANRIVKKFGENLRVTFGDMESVGYEALWKAALGYNRHNGKPFKAYAYTVIKNAMMKELHVLFPVDLKTSWEKDDDFCFGEVFRDSDFDYYDKLHFYCDWEEEEERMKENLTDSLKRLSPDDCSIIKELHGFDGNDKTFKQVGDKRHVSLQAIAKKEKRILGHLYDDLIMCA